MRHRENQIARDIVANLYWRWKRDQRMYKKASENNTNDIYKTICMTREVETWNAFEVSRRILYGNKI